MSLPTTMIVCLIVSCLAAVPAYFVVRRAGGVMRTTVAYLLGFFVGAAMALIPTFVFQASKLDLTESSLGAGLAGAIIGPFTGISWAKHKRKINVTRRDDLNRHLANLYLQVNQDLIDLTPSDVKSRVADNAWYYVDGTEIGPVSFVELSQALAKLQNPRDILVWCARFAKWVRAGDVPQLDPVLPPQRPMVGSKSAVRGHGPGGENG